MDASDRCVYLKFGPISTEQRVAVLNRMGASLSPDMLLSEKFGHPCVWVDGPSDDAAEIAVEDRLSAVRKELDLTDEQVSTTLDSDRL